VTPVVVRFAKRKAAWETADATNIRDVEFKNRDGDYDLRPSVYEVEEGQLVQAFAEHAGAAPIEPPRSTLSINLRGSRFALERTPGKDRFAFTRQQHREISLSTMEELDELIHFACQDLVARSSEISKASVCKYVSEQLATQDKEWIDLLDSPDAKEWLKKLAAPK
jgi:hypothetical protein